MEKMELKELKESTELLLRDLWNLKMSMAAGWRSMGNDDFFLLLCSILVDDVHNCCCIGPVGMISTVVSLEWLVCCSHRSEALGLMVLAVFGGSGFG